MDDPAAAPPDPPVSSARVKELFAAYLTRLEEGEALDFEAFCAAHATDGPALRRLHADWRALTGVLGALGGGNSLSHRLESRFGTGADPRVELDSDGAPAPPRTGTGTDSERARRAEPALARLEHLEERRTFGRYTVVSSVGRGAMGEVLQVWDEDLRRHLAMKVLLEKSRLRPQRTPSAADSRALSRFLEEAQVTGQLDHPGIVPVHEIGLDSKGSVYFTMKLVKGHDLKEVVKRVRAGADGWTLVRALGVLLKVCETMAYAHEKGVVHRDLKPANVMVGRWGAVYVMDWGLAHVLGSPPPAPRARPADERPGTAYVRTDRTEPSGSHHDSPIYTADGDVVGTPAYMSPEQASGLLETIGPQWDVYALGALLYHLLAGHVPYVPPGERRSAHTILAQVLQGPPAPLAECAPDAPPEVVAICERAMARDPVRRYGTMEAFAEDLRAYLEGRVVRAYESGAAAELKKWVRRNRALAAAIGGGLFVALAGLGTTTGVTVQKNRRIAAVNRDLERELVVADRTRLLGLVEEERAIAGPPHEHRAEYARILGAARELAARLPRLRVRLAALDALRAEDALEPGDSAAPDAGTRDGGRDARLDAASVVLAAEPARSASDGVLFESAAAERTALAALVADLERFSAPGTGWLPRLEARVRLAAETAERTVESPQAQELWREAIERIAASPLYGGLRLEPQLGLIPLGPDPASGLEEFAVFGTGEAPERAGDGELNLARERFAIVLVLLPAGTAWMGGQGVDIAAPNYDVLARPDEGPVHEVNLEPFFISKFEMSQAQWIALTGRNPSGYTPKGHQEISLDHPVEMVGWGDARHVLARCALRLPTEAQWEYAARGGLDTPWSTGTDREDLRGYANIADASFLRVSRAYAAREWPSFDDGYSLHAPVDSLRSNAYGLHHVHGNVYEWCEDAYLLYSGSPPRAGDGLRSASEPGTLRAVRGGGYHQIVERARSSARDRNRDFERYPFLGVRPARVVDR